MKLTHFHLLSVLCSTLGVLMEKGNMQYSDIKMFCFQKMDMKTKTETNTPVTFVDVYKEFNDTVAEKFKIMKFKSMVSKVPFFSTLDVCLTIVCLYHM